MNGYLSFVTLDTWTFIFTWVNLLILFFLVKKLFLKPIQKMLEARNSEIEEDYSKAKTAQHEADEMRAEYEEKLSAAHISAEKIVADATLSASLRGDAIVKEAEEKAEVILERAKRNIDAERNAAYESIKGEIGLMAVNIAKKIIEKDIDPKIHDKLIERALEGLGGLGE